MSTKGLPWFRAYAEMVDDEKLRLLAFEDRWHFVALMCCKCAGLLDAGDEPALLRRKLAVKLGLGLRELDAMAARLAELDLIDPVTFQPVAWESRQFASDSDPTARERKARQRERERAARGVSRVTVTNVTRTDTDTDTDTEAKAKAKAGARAAPVELPAWLPGEAWKDWHDYRNSRKGWTAKAQALSLRTLTGLWEQGFDPRAVIEQSIEQGWTGLFRPKNHGAHHETGHRLSAVERVRANVEAAERRDAEAARALPHADVVAADG